MQTGGDTVDAEAARAFLAERFDDVEALVPFTRGEWSRSFAFRSRGRDLVVRFGRYREDYERDRVAASWSRPALPVPAVIEVGDAFDGAYAISVRAFGDYLEELDAARWRATLPSLLGALDEMRRIELPGDGFGSWRADGGAPQPSWRAWLLAVAGESDVRITGWRAALASVPGAEDRFAQCLEALERAAACGAPDLRHVVHGDLTAGNVLVEGDRITAVFDWANSLAGDAMYDIGWLSFWSPWHPGIDVAELVHEVKRRDDDRDVDERIRTCALHVGLDAQRYSAWVGRWEELEQVSARTLRFATP